MPRRGDGLSLLTLLLLGSALIVNEQGELIGRAQERNGSVDLFDAHSNRLGWGRRDPQGTVEFFDPRGQRLGTWDPQRGTLRLQK